MGIVLAGIQFGAEEEVAFIKLTLDGIDLDQPILASGFDFNGVDGEIFRDQFGQAQSDIEDQAAQRFEGQEVGSGAAAAAGSLPALVSSLSVSAAAVSGSSAGGGR